METLWSALFGQVGAKTIAELSYVLIATRLRPRYFATYMA